MTRSDPALRRTRLRVLAFITVAATATISFTSVQHLAASAGFGWLAWLFPLVVDAVAAFGMDVWMRRSGAQRSAGALALSAIGLSLAANVADHYLATGLVLAALLGAIPPIMLAWLLLTLHRHGIRAEVPVMEAEPSEQDRVLQTLMEEPDRIFNRLTIGHPDECWPFTTRSHRVRYATVQVDGVKVALHRAALAVQLGRWPVQGLVVRHLCGNSFCANPNHLAEGTHLENAQDMITHGTANQGGVRYSDEENKATVDRMLALRPAEEWSLSAVMREMHCGRIRGRLLLDLAECRLVPTPEYHSPLHRHGTGTATGTRAGTGAGGTGDDQAPPVPAPARYPTAPPAVAPVNRSADPVPPRTATEPVPGPQHSAGTAGPGASPVPATPAGTETTPAPARVPASGPRPVPAESASERTMVMPRIRPDEAPETRTKVSTPTRQVRRLTSVPVPDSAASNAELAAAVRAAGGSWSRRKVMTTYGVGSTRATAILRLAEGGTDGTASSAR
jgi:hypothetical protein